MSFKFQPILTSKRSLRFYWSAFFFTAIDRSINQRLIYFGPLRYTALILTPSAPAVLLYCREQLGLAVVSPAHLAE